MMTENDISGVVLDISIEMHRVLGPGLFESVYEEVLWHELNEAGLNVQRQKVIDVEYKGMKLPKAFQADLIVEDKVIVEIKSVEALAPVHHKQLLTYLRLTDIKLGLLINFNEALLKNGFHRIANNL